MFPKIVIHHCQEIKEDGNIHYQYKEVDFLVKSSKEDVNLIVFFHGAVRYKEQIPIFRGYNYEFPKTTILCISDKTVEEVDTLSLFWYIHPKYKPIYYTIIQYFVQKRTNILMTGGSGGCFPSIYYASLFDTYCLVQNGQIYLEKYYNFKNLIQKVSSNIIIPQIEEILIQNSCPRIIYFQNKYDTHHYEHHYLPFSKFISSQHWDDRVQFEIFLNERDEKNPEKKPHYLNCPPNTFLKQLIIDYFLNKII